jgi:hypothetical protein
MRITIAAGTLAIAALVVGPASADSILGGSVKQNGQCWSGAKTWDGGTYGYWKACPDAASNHETTRYKPRHQ